jgi:hypothetical protein
LLSFPDGGVDVCVGRAAARVDVAMKIEGKTESDSSSGGESLSSPEKYFTWWSNQLTGIRLWAQICAHLNLELRKCIITF